MELEIFQTGPLDVNTYVLKDKSSKEAIIIDLGSNFDKIYDYLNKDGYKLKFILNTHGHFDHVLGECGLNKTHPEIPIYMHKDDIFHLERCNKELKMWGFGSQNNELPVIKEYIDENSSLNIGEYKITILHTPGHSKGSLSYLIDNKLFSGDALFYNSIGRTDFEDGDYETLINSIKTKLLTLSEDTRVFPGHGPETTIKNEKSFNPYLR